MTTLTMGFPPTCDALVNQGAQGFAKSSKSPPQLGATPKLDHHFKSQGASASISRTRDAQIRAPGTAASSSAFTKTWRAGRWQVCAQKEDIMNWKCALAGVALAVALTPMAALADSASEIENARGKERQGLYLNDRDREHLRRWGGNSDYGRYAYGPYAYGAYGDGYYDGYDDEPDVSVYVDPY
jgi:hypothetical protein